MNKGLAPINAKTLVLSKLVLSLLGAMSHIAAMELTALSEYCDWNLSGLLKIEYAPTSWVNRTLYNKAVSAAGQWKTEVVFSTGDWLILPLLPTEVWEERQQRDAQGVSYVHVVSGVVPALRPAASRLLHCMSSYRYLLRLRDRNGQPWILGTLDFPFDFAYQAQTGDRGSGLNSYEVTFSARMPQPASGYTVGGS